MKAALRSGLFISVMLERPPFSIRLYRPGDIREILRLFYDTVHTVNARDYTPDQIDAWAPPELLTADSKIWEESLASRYTVVAELGDGAVAGFGELEEFELQYGW